MVKLNAEIERLKRMVISDHHRQRREELKQEKKYEMDKILKMQELQWKWNYKRQPDMPTENSQNEIQLLEESISDLKSKLRSKKINTGGQPSKKRLKILNIQTNNDLMSDLEFYLEQSSKFSQVVSGRSSTVIGGNKARRLWSP